MIIPTPEFDPLFADDGVAFQTKMIEYIRSEFADMLGSRVLLLQKRDGLDMLARMYNPVEPMCQSRKAA